jgi:hypothetical protein
MVEQLGVAARLQRGDRSADSRLRQMKRLGGPRDLLVFPPRRRRREVAPGSYDATSRSARGKSCGASSQIGATAPAQRATCAASGALRGRAPSSSRSQVSALRTRSKAGLTVQFRRGVRSHGFAANALVAGLLALIVLISLGVMI